MDDLKIVTASNIINLRTNAKMTQAELAEKLSYSDKSVSKWERAEALPDATVLKKMSEIFGVTVDYLLSSHDTWTPSVSKKEETFWQSRIIMLISLVGIWTLALLIFIIFWIAGRMVWLPFVYAFPVSMITLLVLHTIWEKGKHNFYIIAVLIVSVFTTVYFSFWQYRWWQIFLLLLPAELLVYLASRLKKPLK